jgi:nucleoporin POM152
MNPDDLPFCIDAKHSSVNIPLRFNQTSPIHIELLRFDFDTNTNETITLSSRERRRSYEDRDQAISLISYAAKKPGLYRLHRVIDESKLEVQRKMSDTLVVRCPKVSVTSTGSDRCLGDLSDLTMEIEGTAPLKIVYTRTANKEESTHRFQSIQPENFVSPLLGFPRATTLAVPGSQDFSWARTHRIKVPLNESMIPGGPWVYSIDEIHDATGNVANFSARGEDGEHLYPRGSHLEQAFMVHERPVAQLSGCDTRRPLMVASGKTAQLPVNYPYSIRNPHNPHILTWKFSPLDTLTASGDHGSDVSVEQFVAKGTHSSPAIREPGLYTLIGVQSDHCEGEIREPASCLLLNPPKPQLSISSENISDKCAGNSIGLMVDLDLVGTPPFVVRYNIMTKSGTTSERVEVPGLRHQLELRPRSAGHFKYQFTSIDDAVYQGLSLSDKGLALEQSVKPPASAQLRRPPGPIDACIEEPVMMNVELSGEQPFTLEYELIHDGRKRRQKVSGIESDIYRIKTDPLVNGGEYSIALVSIQDKTGCKIFLSGEAKFTVRHQRPKASFGHIESKFTTTDIEGRQVRLPLRLTGQAPWTIKYRNVDDATGKIIEKRATYTNDIITVDQEGTYEILEVSDDQCPGTVEPSASTFEVKWLPRPEIKLASTAALIPDGDKYFKREVCEGDVDAVEINLIGMLGIRRTNLLLLILDIGTSPYHVKYQVRHRNQHGSGSISNKQFDAALGLATIAMDTTKPGTYEYRFSELSDVLYEHDPRKFKPLIIEQTVNRKPSAYFTKPGQSYKYCKEQMTSDEIIPIKLEGAPPFYLEVDIKHQSSSRPETVKVANIESNHYDFRIPHNVLSLGISHVSVRKVRDSRGCQQKTEYGAPKVQVQVYDAPTIYPLEARTEYCVGERISYTLSGAAPFEVYYTFQDVPRKAKSANTNFRRIAEKPGTFTITAVSDKASECKANTNITKVIHEMPSVRVSQGKQVEVDIHEGGEAEIVFEFWGTPPFEFTYTRSTNAKRGQKSTVLETRHDISYEHSKTIQSSQEGTYEVVAIKDKYCSFSTQPADGTRGQKLLQF